MSGAKKTIDWIALTAAVISFCALLVSVVTLMRDAEDRRISVLPIPDISYFHRQEDFRISLRNRGLGPMLVSKLSFVHPGGQITERLFPGSHFDKAPLIYMFDPLHLVRIDTVSSISPGEEIDLARYTYSSRKTKNFAACLEELATGIEIRVAYSDIYGSVFEPFSYRLPAGHQICE